MQRSRKICRLLIAAAAGLPLAAAAPAIRAQTPPQAASVMAQPTLPEPIATRQTLFSIPFTLPPASNADTAPVEVRLYASTDSGLHWDQAGSVTDLKLKNFTFRARRDGEYWFLLRTIDRHGKMRPGPENTTGPELRVIVDTAPPSLELHGSRRPGGQIVVEWKAADPLLRPETLKIEYQIGVDRVWRPVEIPPTQPAPGGRTFNGDAPIAPSEPGNVTIHAEISDRAGNVAVAQTTVADPTAEDHRALSGLPSNSGPPANPPTTDGAGAWPTDRTTDQPLAHAGDGPALVGGNGGADAGAGGANWRPATNPGWPPRDNGAGPMTSPIASQPNPPLENRFVPDQSGSPYTQGLPQGERPYMVNSKRFALDYEVESVGPSGVSKIEIWGTRDGGRTWQSYGVEPGKRGPIKVRVDEEGLYGFRITVRDGAGFGGKPPRGGDLPELWVGVDTTKPAVRITGAELGTGQHAGELAIRWEATDKLLAARPITLSFAERAGGPYSTIAAGLENSGFFAWRYDNRVPDRIYLRIEARDEAGNIGAFETPDPIALDPGRPQGHLRTVQPLGEDQGRVQTYEFNR